MISTIVKPEQECGVGAWSSMFPNRQLTHQQSSVFVKKLLTIAISNIAYLRSLFPEDAFGDRALEGIHLKILKEDICPNATQLIRWVKGCFDALDKKYLRQITVGIYQNKDNPETLIESYSFRFSYTQDTTISVYRNDSQIASTESINQTKKSTLSMLRTIVILSQTLEPLPPNSSMVMKLLYYDEITPPDYQPPGFIATDSDIFQYQNETVNLRIGCVETPFHTLKLRIRTDAKQFEEINPNSETVKEEKHLLCGNKPGNDCASEHPTFSLSPSLLNDGLENPCQSRMDTTNQRGNVAPQSEDDFFSPSTSYEAQVAKDDKGVRCGCCLDEDDGLMIMCSICKYWQHAICYRITEQKNAPEIHVCHRCAKVSDDTRLPTDYSLQRRKRVAIQGLCLWRRTIAACLEFKRIRVPILAERLGVNSAVAKGLFARLEKEQFLKSSSININKLDKEVDGRRIMEVGFPKYLYLMDSVQSQERGKENELTDGMSDPVTLLSAKTKALKVSDNNSEQQNATRYPVLDNIDGPETRSSRKRFYSQFDHENVFDISSSLTDNNAPSEVSCTSKKRSKTSLTEHPISIIN